ncbi:hypothetical protein EDB87DRAFT_505759 [Lactarius vividus]|nr:hypothetical protein EDB87DRAFT_505759 [Lactarius vividus]
MEQRPRLVPQASDLAIVPALFFYLPKYPSSLAHADLQLDGLECSSFPSGLGFIEQDVIYVTVPHISLLLLCLCTSLFTSTHGPRGVCIFTWCQTSKQCQHGFHLSSLGILLARSLCPHA